MSQQKPYAIKCTTDEQARECIAKELFYIICGGNTVVHIKGYNRKIQRAIKEGYTIISYDEAISLGLLGEKKCNHGQLESCSNCVKINSLQLEPQKVEPVKKCRCEKCDEFDCGCFCKCGLAHPDCICDIDIEKIFPKHINQVNESPSEDNLVEKIMEDVDRYTRGDPHIYTDDLEKILKKHLSSK